MVAEMSERERLEHDEKESRKRINENLKRAGWIIGNDCLEEVSVGKFEGEYGFADYILYDGPNGLPLAVVEAKNEAKGPAAGRHQAELYAESLTGPRGMIPAIFLSDGYETLYVEPHPRNGKTVPERKVNGFYSRRDLVKAFNLIAGRSAEPQNLDLAPWIERYYQKNAVKTVAESFAEGRRRALLVMATGSGKTRTAAGVADLMMRAGWAKNILFLADRTALVEQARASFVDLMSDTTTANLCDGDPDYSARCVFSTYPTMSNLIDRARERDGSRVFTTGHFDLVILDEAHRSVYNKYKSIIDHFDAPVLGLTATPKDDIDRDTYRLFGLQAGCPTYAYTLRQAIDDEWLVDFKSARVGLKLMRRGIVYGELDLAEREKYEATFTEEDGLMPEEIESTEINRWVFNRDTTAKALDILMNTGLKVDSGSIIGKTIIFAKSKRHAEFIRKVFYEEYPSYDGNFCKVIVSGENEGMADDLIRRFKGKGHNPQIAISVDMLDTGVDVPDILNLVFFKPVYSKAKFWQMIGRGTRTCKGLFEDREDKDKKYFLIFDLCGNFEFFEISPDGAECGDTPSLQSRIFMLRSEMAMHLQASEYQTQGLDVFRDDLVKDLRSKVRELERNNYSVRQQLKTVDRFSEKETWKDLSDVKVMELRDLSPLILPYEGDTGAVRLDYDMNKLELASLIQKQDSMTMKKVRMTATVLSKKATIPDIAKRMGMLNDVKRPGYLESCGIPDFERIRREMRELMKYLDGRDRRIIYTDFTDTVESIEIVGSTMDDGDLAPYREKAEHYIRTHADEPAIRKLHTNEPLNETDVADLERILWSEVGTREDYEREFQSKPLTLFVRQIVGLDRAAAKEAFSRYLDETKLDSRQTYLVGKVIDYVAEHGVIDRRVLIDRPFNKNGSVADIMPGSILEGFIDAIEDINGKAGIKER